MTNNKRGEILAVTMGLSIVFILLGYYAIYFATVKRETFEKENMRTRAFWLAEAGRTAVRAELMYLFQSGGILESSGVSTASLIGYGTNQTPLGLLTDYCVFDKNISIPVDTDHDPNTPDLQIAGRSRTFSPPTAFNFGGDTSLATYSAEVKIIPTPGVSPNPSVLNGVYTFHYQYQIESTGSVAGNTSLDKKVTITGVPIGPIITVPPSPPDAYDHFRVIINPAESFALYALFTGTPGDLTWFIPGGEFKGPVHSNTFWRFLGNPSAHFYDVVTQVSDKPVFYNNGSPITLGLDEKGNLPVRNGDIDVPTFDQGFTRVSPITLPAMGSYNQDTMKKEALGGMTEPGLYDIGLWLGSSGNNKVTGGVFISASSSQITMGTDGSDKPKYDIVVGVCTKTVTVDYDQKTTTIVNRPTMGNDISVCDNTGTLAGSYSGIPAGMHNQGLIIYSRGGINTTLSGVVQKDTAITVAAESNITISNNITYEDDPITNANAKNILGVVSWVQGYDGEKGIVIAGDYTLPYNLRLDGIYMAPDSKVWVDYRDYLGKKGIATVFGGLIESYYGAFGKVDDLGSGQITKGYLRKLIYDIRINKGVVPPYFPTTKPLAVSQLGLETKPSWSGD